MRVVLRISAVCVAVVLASCVGVESTTPSLQGAVAAVSSLDIHSATVAAQQRLAADGHSAMPIFRVQVFSATKIELYAGEHYGSRSGYPVVGVVVQRIKGRWRVTSAEQLEREDVIVS